MASNELDRPREYRKMPDMKCCSSFEEINQKATDLLLLRDFDGCIAECRYGIASAKSNMEIENSTETMEKLCLLGIQALAEMDSWPTVLPFVQEVYSGIERCPSTVVQLCILLHTRVKEYSQCHAIASIWLRHEDNTKDSGYLDVVRLYVTQAMVPNGQMDLVDKFLHSCTALSSEDMTAILKEAERLSRIVTDLSTSDVEPSRNQKSSSRHHHSSVHEMDDEAANITLDNVRRRILQTAKRLGVMIAKQFSFIELNTVIKIAFVMVCFYAVTIQANLKDSLIDGLIRATVAWQGLWSVLKSMFGPIRSHR